MTIYAVDLKEKCPHCRTIVQFVPAVLMSKNGKVPLTEYRWDIFEDSRILKKFVRLYISSCPSCDKVIISASIFRRHDSTIESTHVLWPRSHQRIVPTDVPEYIASDYLEATAVLYDSPKASAAISRRCLQAVLVEAGGVNHEANLSQQIDEVMPHLPAYIAESIDAIRHIGISVILQRIQEKVEQQGK